MRVLIIEDNPDIAANLGDYLEDHGHTLYMKERDA